MNSLLLSSYFEKCAKSGSPEATIRKGWLRLEPKGQMKNNGRKMVKLK